MSNFSKKLLQFTFTLTNSTFANTGKNTTTVAGLRATCSILKAGFPQMGSAVIRIYGMDLSTMNQLSTLGQRVFQGSFNQVLVTAGSAETGFGIAFWGNINNAYIDFTEYPNVALQCEAFTESGLSILPKLPTSITGAADVIPVLQGLAAAGNLAFENNGVSGITIPNLYIYGSVLDQIKDIQQQLSKVIGIGIIGNTSGGTLAVWNLKTGRNGVSPTISSLDGSMIGYPSYTPNGIMVKCYYNPNVQFQKSIIVFSQFLTAANRTWQVFGLDHNLDTALPNGKWETTVQGFDPNTGGAPTQR